MKQNKIDARMEAFEEASVHLEGDWTHDPEERKQSEIAARIIRNYAYRWYCKRMEKAK